MAPGAESSLGEVAGRERDHPQHQLGIWWADVALVAGRGDQEPPPPVALVVREAGADPHGLSFEESSAASCPAQSRHSFGPGVQRLYVDPLEQRRYLGRTAGSAAHRSRSTYPPSVGDQSDRLERQHRAQSTSPSCPEAPGRRTGPTGRYVARDRGRAARRRARSHVRRADPPAPQAPPRRTRPGRRRAHRGQGRRPCPPRAPSRPASARRWSSRYTYTIWSLELIGSPGVRPAQRLIQPTCRERPQPAPVEPGFAVGGPLACRWSVLTVAIEPPPGLLRWSARGGAAPMLVAALPHVLV